MDNNFRRWVEDNKAFYEEKGISIDYANFNENESDSSAVVDYITSSLLGRVTVLRRGLIDAEILDINTEQNIYFEHFELRNGVKWDELLHRFFLILSEHV